MYGMYASSIIFFLAPVSSYSICNFSTMANDNATTFFGGFLTTHLNIFANCSTLKQFLYYALIICNSISAFFIYLLIGPYLFPFAFPYSIPTCNRSINYHLGFRFRQQAFQTTMLHVSSVDRQLCLTYIVCLELEYLFSLPLDLPIDSYAFAHYCFYFYVISHIYLLRLVFLGSPAAYTILAWGFFCYEKIKVHTKNSQVLFIALGRLCFVFVSRLSSFSHSFTSSPSRFRKIKTFNRGPQNIYPSLDTTNMLFWFLSVRVFLTLPS